MAGVASGVWEGDEGLLSDSPLPFDGRDTAAPFFFL